MSEDKNPKIRVLVRKRPLNKKQLSRNQNDIITVEGNQTVVVREQKYKVDLTPFIDQYRFNFDGAYNENATNQQIYLTSIRPLVDCAFDGARVSCFAYGQTGSGKTYTMLGDGDKVYGLYLLATFDIFQKIKQYPSLNVSVSFYEIYCGKLFDLLNERNILFARQDAKNNVNIVGLSQRKVINPENLMQIIQFGMGVRVTSQNGTNDDSSRSHAILQISLKNKNKIHGKISFIDLAGSQRAADHADQLIKQTRIDGAEINKSLLALKQCIRALDQNKNHTPFRGSKLTMVLRDSFTGYCRTVMIGNISPNSSSCQNTLNTLKYADRVKQLKKPSKQNQLIQFDNIDKLSKELMLPRQLIQKRVQQAKFQSDQQHFQEQQEIIKKPIQHRKNHNMSHKNNQNKIVSISQQNNRRHSQYQKPMKNPDPYKSSPNRSPYQHHDSPYRYQLHSEANGLHPDKLVSNYIPIQQAQPVDDFESLSKKHENYISLILQQQQNLMRAHEKHINHSIELVKNEMVILGDADKIGSSIDDYLDKLENSLNHQLNSIMGLKGKVSTLKNYLRQSKKIQELYVRQLNNLQHQGDGDNILDHEDKLFY